MGSEACRANAGRALEGLKIDRHRLGRACWGRLRAKVVPGKGLRRRRRGAAGLARLHNGGYYMLKGEGAAETTAPKCT